MAVFSIEYTEPKQDTYKAVRLDLLVGYKKKKVLFNSGDIVVDWYMFNRFLVNLPEKVLDKNMFCGSSSNDHFFMDGKKFTTAYLNPKTLEFYTKEEMKKNPNWYEEGIKNIIPSDGSIKTFAQLKEYVKSKTGKIGKKIKK